MTQASFVTPYPGYDVLAKRDTPSWNELTRQVVARRLDEVPNRRFFEHHEWQTMEAICDRLLPQPERVEQPIPLVPFIDEKLHLGRGEGYRFEGLPPIREAYRRALRGFDQDGAARFGQRFVELSPAQRDTVIRAVEQGEPQGEAWRGMAVKTFFRSVLLSEVVAVYYAHPAAWSEIGFGGPASPRGYVRLSSNRIDPWEAEEKRP